LNHRIPGIHHITAIAGDPQANIDFYAGTLGLRLVKLTVNFDDPGTYHLYYGDGAGSPGTIMTFFPWPGAPGGRTGAGQATATAFAISRDSVGFWTERLSQHGVAAEKPVTRFGEEVIALVDPDGLALELVASDNPATISAWDRASVAPEHVLRGFHSVTLTHHDSGPTGNLLAEIMGFEAGEEENGRTRYRADRQAPGATVDVLRAPQTPLGQVAVGTIHHVAFRTANDTAQLDWQQSLIGKGFDVSPVMDRIYFHSIYFREPGGVLFEIATDPPGFLIDEPVQSLGTGLKLPPWLEAQRGQIERIVMPIRLPDSAKERPIT